MSNEIESPQHNKLFTLILTKNNYLTFLEVNLVDYFLRQLKKFCKIAPEFTYQPILYHWNELWRYDSEHYWMDNIGRCSFRFQNIYFGFNDTINKFESIYIDWKSFEIKQASQNKVKQFCGVPVDYLSDAQQKAINEQQAKWKVENEQDRLIAKLQETITMKRIILNV